MTNRPRLLTVILNYKTPEMTLKAAAAALEEIKPFPGEIIIVDNDSQDGSFEKMTDAVISNGWSRSVSVLRSGRNGGFGAGNNFGILAGMSGSKKPDFIYILNSDAFPDKGSIRALIDALESHPRAAFAGSYIHGPDGTPHETAFRFPSVNSELEGAARFGPISRFFKDDIVAMELPRARAEVDWLAGASMMMRREALEKIGLFDETFFLYFEETDLCLRAQRAGWSTIYVRDSSVTHIGSVSTGMKTWTRMPEYWFASRHYYFSKNHGRAYTRRANIAHIAGACLWRLRRFVQRKPQMDPDHFLRDLIAHSWKSRKRRLPSASVPKLTTPAKIGAK